MADTLRQQIDTLLATLIGEGSLSTSGSFHAADSNTLAQAPSDREVLRSQLRAVQEQAAKHWDEMAYNYPALTATQKAPVLSVDQARSLAAELDAVLVEYYHHTEGWCAFVVTPTVVYYVPLPLIDDPLLEHMMNWVQRIEHLEGRGPLSVHRLYEWHGAVFAPIQAYLSKEQPIVLAPFSLLHVLPLAAACDPHTWRFVAEDYQITFAPSLSALYAVHEQARRQGGDGSSGLYRLLNVAYPGDPKSDHYLPNVLPEVQAISEYFTQVIPLYEEAATPEAVVRHSRDQDVVHFGCHGQFDLERPEQSGLLLAGGWLTVQLIIAKLRLNQARLVTLGACLSGRAALQRGEEHVGLMQTMLTTGVQAVVASLWQVDDAATRTLFEVFYARLVTGQSPARALQAAARFVRERPGRDHPYYWAAFQINGLAHRTQEPAQAPLLNDRAVRVDAPISIQTRGGRPMKADRQVEGALILLAQMSEYPNEVLGVLNVMEQNAVVAALEAWAEQVAVMQNDADLLKLADAIYRLVEDQPGLRALLLPSGTDVAEGQSQRKVTLDAHLATTGEQAYAQKYAPQMRNTVIDFKAQFEAALRAAEKPGDTPEQGKKS